MANPTGPSIHQGDLYVAGNLWASTQSIPANAINDAQIASGAGIGYAKVNQLIPAKYAQPNVTAVTETKELHVVRAVGGGTVLEFAAGCIVAPIGAATVTFDLKKNGTTVLSAVITLNSSSTPYVIQTASISVPAAVQSDVFTIVVTATAGGGTLPTGVFAQARISEAAV